jgi:hypothetical protein
MPAARVIEAVDVLETAGFGLATGFPNTTLDQLDIDGLEEGLDNGVDRRGQDCEGTKTSGSYEVTSRPLLGQPDGRQVNAMTRSQS